MNKTLLVIAAFLASGCQTSPPQVTVQYRGALRTLTHAGDLRAVIALDSLQHRPHLYALGAVENLKGEVLIYDSAPLVASVRDSAVTIARDFAQRAALLVYAQVNTWRELEIPQDLPDAHALETFLQQAAAAHGRNLAAPFPFLLTGTVPALHWHVIDWPAGDSVHTHEKHKAAGLHGKLQQQNVEILGFYSEQHQGIFTHRESRVHLHVKSAAGDFAAHVDDLHVDRKMRLFLPQ